MSADALDLDAVRCRVERYRQEWVAERTALDRTLASGGRLPDGYWQAEHRTKALYLSALALLEALAGDVHNDG